MALRKEQQARTRNAILAGARQLFQERSFDKTSMAMIAAASGISVGGLYIYFKNKHAIFEAVFGSSLRDARRELELNIMGAV
jgi:AcrR family transcriptional regulator